MNRRYPVVVFVLALIGFAPALPAAEAVSADPVYAASFKDFNRNMQPLGQWKGKTLLVYFWATWCKPCLSEIPQLVSLYDTYRSKNVVIVGVAIDQADKVEKFTKEHRVTYPIVYGGNEAVSLSKQMGNTVGGLPFLIVIDAKGEVVETILGEIPEGKLEQILKQLAG
ncbi:MAG: TlpA family protein disulfide reductase [Burkholderiales bacterium]